jgi:citrate synthase
VVFLLFRGELPTETERDLFRALCIALINPGPRHPAAQASIIAGVGKTATVGILPVALSIYGGEFDGAAQVEEAIRFYRKSSRTSSAEILSKSPHIDKDSIVGFGTLYGDPDGYAERLLENTLSIANIKVLSWAKELHDALKPKGIGILKTGFCAAVLADLGFQPRQGSALMQLMAAPGLLAHGLEFSNKPMNKMLFESDSVYEIEDTDS